MAEPTRRTSTTTATTTTGLVNGNRMPLHPKLRKIAVASRTEGLGQQRERAGAGGAGGAGSPVTSRSRNSTAAEREVAAATASTRKKPATRARAKDVLSALSVGATAAAASSGGSSRASLARRARTPSPVLSRPQQQQQQQQQPQSPSRAAKREDSPAVVLAGLPKSASVPADLKAQHQAQPQQPGILKRSSSFLASLASTSRWRSQRGRSPARKCVSFSSDTSFAESEKQRPPDGFKKTAVHEAKLYRKGVLQDRNGCEEKPTNLPLSWEESLGGPRALLGAAQDGDDELIKKIVTLANKSGLGNIDINAVDSSGRTAISYMAGNGSALMLEACLSFHGADANLPDNEGNTPLHFAAQAGQTECLNILLQRCPTIEVDARNSLGFTPLMKAALQGRTKCAKILLFAGANPTLRDHGRGLRAEQWARFCGRYVCAEVIERFARHRLLEKTTSCRWGSEPELAAQVLQGKLMPIPSTPVPPPPSGLKSKIRRVFRTSSNSDKSFSLVSQLTSAALCASSPVLPKPGDVSPVVKSLLRPLSVPQLRITLVAPQDIIEKTSEKCSHSTTFTEKIESSMVKPPRTKKKSK